MVLILVDVDRRGQDLYKGTKCSIIEPLLSKTYKALQQPPIGKIY